MMSITHRTFVLFLLCACGAVNIMFHALKDTSIKHSKTEHFIELNAEDGPSVLPYTKGKLYTQAFTANNRSIEEGMRNPDTVRLRDIVEHRVFTFSVNNHTLCERDALKTGEKWNLVIIVISKVDHFITRNAIRNTWASELKTLDATIVFLVGQSGQRTINEQVKKEAELYHDVVQVDLIDAYTALSFKSIAMLQWLVDYCDNAKFYLKADDDSYVHVENVLKEFNRCKHDRFFLCHVFRMAPPIREHWSKWFVSVEEYPDKYYPTYCSGSSYGFSEDILPDLYRSVVKTKLFGMEDVFVSGMAAEKIDVRHVHSWRFAFLKRTATGCEYQNASTGHEVTLKQMYVIFAQLKNKEIDCDTQQNTYLLKGEPVIVV